MNKTKNEILNRYDFKTKLAFVHIHSCASGIDLENISIIRNNIINYNECSFKINNKIFKTNKKSLIKIIRNIDEYILKIEKHYVNLLLSIWANKKNTFSNIYEFISCYDKLGCILTKNILNEFLRNSNYDYNVNSFIKKFKIKRSENSLKFVSKDNLIDLCNKLYQI